MSVSGEFDRILGAFVDFLEASTTPEVSEQAALLAEVRQARSGASFAGAELEEAAQRVRSQLTGASALQEKHFSMSHERRGFCDNRDHLLSICEAILGPAKPVDSEGGIR